MIESKLQKIINSHKVLICVGSGGVGKTTVSAAIAVKAAQVGKKVLVMTIDPARRLKVALGLGNEQSNLARVPEQNYKGELYASILNAEKLFLDFIMQSSTEPEKAERLVKNRLYQQLSTKLSGSQEFTSLLQLSRLVHDKQFDLIVLDTPPAQHAIDFLEAPERIGTLFQESIVRWFVNEKKEKMSVIKKLITKGTQTAFAALEYITGSVFMAELNDFFNSVGAIQNEIAATTRSSREILSSESTGFVLVTGFNKVKIEEAMALKNYLSERHYNLLATIINRSLPPFYADKLNLSGTFKSDMERFVQFQQKSEQEFSQFTRNYGEKLLIVRTKDFNEDITKVTVLERFGDELEKAFS